MNTLTHITMNDCKTQTVNRTEKAETTIAEVKRIIMENGECMPGNDNILLKHVAQMPGRVGFILYVEKAPCIACHACWYGSLSKEAWHCAENLFFNATELDVALDFGWENGQPPSTPWVASVLLTRPESIPGQAAYNLGVLEVCVPWAFMDIDNHIG